MTANLKGTVPGAHLLWLDIPRHGLPNRNSFFVFLLFFILVFFLFLVFIFLVLFILIFLVLLVLLLFLLLERVLLFVETDVLKNAKTDVISVKKGITYACTNLRTGFAWRFSSTFSRLVYIVSRNFSYC